MNQIATTKLSSKGQIVIPENIRDRLKLHTGDQFIVLAERDVVILKMVTHPSMDEYADLIAQAHRSAKSVGLTNKALGSAIKVVRQK